MHDIIKIIGKPLTIQIFFKKIIKYYQSIIYKKTDCIISKKH